MRRMLALLALTIATAAAAQQLPPEATIRDVLKEHLGADPGRVAIVVGIIEPAGRRIVSYGAKEIDARSIFEIGPITKVFTSRRAGTSYETLIRSRILEPLGMNNTSIKLSEAQQQRLAVGYDQQRRVAPNWDASPFAGAAALHSDAGDLLTLLSAYLGYTKSPLAAAMTSQVAVRRPTGIPTLDAALGWVVLNHNGQELVCLNGGTDGYHSYIAYDAKRRAGVVVLTNSTDNLADIGQQFLTQP